ncbi:Fur family transcriptional regulator [Virgibacillus soli]|uniref:Fur family transcriptional regulator n=1 Tax=Paracerasibacillus soli TaxID=480284 RepID=A0ABU5CSH0_9BACI|nr:Fur family transcriptional regulator [Virgibacillus soli]MDY0408821.1 Fur family transcriptional regulator [Virgibacillus soli]
MNMNEAIRILKEKGYKATGRRKDMLEYFAHADGYRTAKHVLQHMETLHEGISFDTIYRNLNLYDEVGILETTDLDGEKHFRMKCTTSHHHHFICRDCGKTKDVDICPMEEVAQSLANYRIDDHKFEIYGVCPTCQIG